MNSSVINLLYFGSSKGIGLTEHLTEYAIGLKNQGINIIVIHNGNEQRLGLIDQLQKNGIKSVSIDNVENWKTIFNAKKLSNLIDDHNIDIIQCQGIYHLTLNRIAKLFSKKKPKTVTYVHAYAHRNWYSNIFLYSTNPLLNRWSDLIFAVSKQTKDTLLRTGIDVEKTVVVYNSLNIKKVKDMLEEENLDDFKNTLDIIKNNKSIIFASASLTQKKGHLVLIHAAKKVINQFPGAYFILSGVGEYKDELSKIINELNIEKNILFIGRINYSSLIKLMKHADVAAVPSYAETFCHALVEPMLVGTPSISTPVGIAEEIIVDGKTGYIVPIGDHEKLADRIIALIQNESLANQIGDNGMKLVKNKFNIDTISKQIVDTYYQLLKS
ncbi:glycosyltransferase family 4 protein [Methanococcoides sp. SA1]|nr:glycosyltransferase family 4 protein [Methanococcoides sp. SA1]